MVTEKAEVERIITGTGGIVVVPMGDAVKLIAKGLQSSRVYEPILTPDKLAA